MIEVKQLDSIQVIRFKRPEKKNAITSPMYEALSDALEGGDQSTDVAVHLITGCEGVFTAGNDITEFEAFAEGGELGGGVIRFLKALPKVQKPLVAAVDGLAIGIGTTMLFHCDMVLASQRAMFKTPFLDLGLVPEAGSSLLATKILGPIKAFELLCAGVSFSADEAIRVGLINRIVPDAELENEAINLCKNLASKPREAMKIARNLIRSSMEGIEERINTENEAFKDRLSSNEAQAAFKAFLNR